MSKKRVVYTSIAVLLLMLSTLYVYNAYASTTTVIKATVDNTPTSIGQTFTATVDITGAENLWAWNINVTWNPAVLNATKVSKGPFLTSNGDSDAFMSGTIDNANGTIKGGPSQALLTAGSVSGAGNLTKITFVVVGIGVSNISLNNIRLLDPTTPDHKEMTFSLGPTLTINIPSSSPTPTPTTNPSPTPTDSPQNQAAIKVITNKLGYLPGDLVLVSANVTYNNAPVASKDVAFTIRLQNNTNIGTIVNRTDSNGIAIINFRIPEPEPNPESIFGAWSVLASVDVAQNNLTDTTRFSVGYSIIVKSVSVSNSTQRLTNLPINVTLETLGEIPQGLTLTATVFDSAQVPLGTSAVSINTQSQGVMIVRTSILIPAWAFTGNATIYVNVLTLLPEQGGVPYYPQIITQSQIV